LKGLPAFESVVPLVLHHHERWDGSGYPHCLKGDTIPLGARIVAITDAYHGLTTRRAYRDAMDRQAAIDLLKQDSGTLWDPDLLALFAELVNA
jgi:putative two-component system response regulator